VGRGFATCGTTQNAVILSGAKNLSFFACAWIEERFFAALTMTNGVRIPRHSADDSRGFSP
jgi:hypothetical protein